MGLRIATNVSALNAQKNLYMTQINAGKSMARLASGQRINQASDDAAGLAISENLKGQIRGLIEALKARRLWRAALDVFATEPTPASRWAEAPGVLLTPHRAGGTTEGIPQLLAQAVDNVQRFLEGQPVTSPVPG